MPLPNKTLELIDKVEAGDRAAALDLAELYKPETISEFCDFVRPERPIPTWLFDALADAYHAYTTMAAA